MVQGLTIVALIVALLGGGFAWSAQVKLDASERAREKLVTTNSLMAERIRTAQTQRDLARNAAAVAQKERARVAIQARKYETVRDAFRKGNFNDPLPDDFKLLISCLLRGATGINQDGTDCP